jgi:hypothetical protein
MSSNMVIVFIWGNKLVDNIFLLVYCMLKKEAHIFIAKKKN